MEEISQKNEENESISLDNINVVEAPTYDITVYEGQRVKIEKAKIKEVIDYYPAGIYNPDSTKKKKVLEITTSPIMEVDENGNKLSEPVKFVDNEGNEKFLRITHRFNLQEVDGNVVVSNHPRCALWTFMRKLGVEKPKDIVGKLVTVTTVPSKKPGEEDRRFLDIVTK